MNTYSRIVALLAGATLFSAPAAAQETWTDRISLKGDLRLRYEGIDNDIQERRERSRYRVRLGLSADVYEDVKLIFSLATGSNNPTSRNVTFGDSFTSDEFGLELAYVDWSINDDLTFYGGKMKNPLYRAGGAPLIYDGDLNPEGFSLKYDNERFFASANMFLVDERAVGDDSQFYAAQAGMKFGLGDAGKLTAGVGYFGYTNTVGNEPFFIPFPFGNTIDINGNYVYDYRNTEIFGTYDASVADMPLQVFAQYTVNNEVSIEDTAYAIGAKIGSAKAKGTWQFAYTYMDIEADSVIGAFNDSDFGGGGTDASGHSLKGKYMIRDRIGLGASLFLNEVDEFQGTKRDYSRFQLDVEFKFQ